MRDSHKRYENKVKKKKTSREELYLICSLLEAMQLESSRFRIDGSSADFLIRDLNSAQRFRNKLAIPGAFIQKLSYFPFPTMASKSNIFSFHIGLGKEKSNFDSN